MYLSKCVTTAQLHRHRDLNPHPRAVGQGKRRHFNAYMDIGAFMDIGKCEDESLLSKEDSVKINDNFMFCRSASPGTKRPWAPPSWDCHESVQAGQV